MKITNKKLQEIIKEELNEMMGNDEDISSLEDIPPGDMDEVQLKSAIAKAVVSLGLQRVKEIVEKELSLNQETQTPTMMENQK